MKYKSKKDLLVKETNKKNKEKLLQEMPDKGKKYIYLFYKSLTNSLKTN
jgi:hypothetical protein